MKVAGAAALASFSLTLAAIPLAAHGSSSLITVPGSRPDDAAMLLDFHRSGADQMLAAGARALSVVLVIVVAAGLWRSTRRGNSSHPVAILALGIAACAIVAATTLLGFVELRGVAADFAGSGPRTPERARHLIDGNLRLVGLAELAGGFMLGLWGSLASYEAMRVGILSRLVAGIGIGAGLFSAIGFPLGPALFLAWLVGVGIAGLGHHRDGRPGAWTGGRPVAEPRR